MLEALPAPGTCGHVPPDATDTFAEVLAGMEDANSRFCTTFAVARVHYGTDDTGPAVVYRLLAVKLVEHLVRQSV